MLQLLFVNALGVAIFNNDEKDVVFLLERGVDPNQKDEQGFTALETACDCGRYDIAKILLQYGANPNHFETNTSALRICVEDGSLELLKLLVQWGGDVNQSTATDDLITIAFQRGHKACANFLKKKGAFIGKHLERFAVPTEGPPSGAFHGTGKVAF